MFIIPFERRSKVASKAGKGFSVSAVSKSVLVVAGFFGLVGLSVFYHSLLYGYTMPGWAVPMMLLSVVPFGYRSRVAISHDRTALYTQAALFGVKLKECVYNSAMFTDFHMEATHAIDNQYYFVVNGDGKRVSVYYCKLNAKRIPKLSLCLGGMLGLKVQSA